MLVVGLLFALGYLAIAFERPLGVNKAASALLVGVTTWTAVAIGREPGPVVASLLHHLGEVSGVVFFVLGAMVVVELIDAHRGFEFITSRITTRSRRKLLVAVTALSFVLSAVLDNLTTSVVMMSVVRKLVKSEDDRMRFGGMVVVAANAGGAWSPIGDVTTTMLWAGGQVTSWAMIRTVIVPSLVSVLVPLAWVQQRMKGEVLRAPDERSPRLEAWKRESEQALGPDADRVVATLPPEAAAVGQTLVALDLRARSNAWVASIDRDGRTLEPAPNEPLRAGDALTLRGDRAAIGRALGVLAWNEADEPTSPVVRVVVFATGVAALLSVPLFSALTHLPPFMGILLGLGVLWAVTEVVHRRRDDRERPFSVASVLQRVDSSSVLFFLGILLAIGALGSAGLLSTLASTLDRRVGDPDVITLLIGLASSVVDNVPLVAAAQGMYPLAAFPVDHGFWLFLAYCAGTGGSILIIGSAAGVAVMGVQRIGFGWYVRHMSLPALAGYAAGAGAYLAQRLLLG
ncbi:MAG: SLC13 family permease [Polyangiaceae bacterium]